MSNKYLLTGAALMLMMLLHSACSKNEYNSGSPASIQAFNALSDGTVLSLTFSDQRPEIFRTLRVLTNATFANASNRFHMNTSPQPFQLFNRPDTMAKDGPILTGTLDYENGSIYSLVFYGSKSTAKYALRKDIIPPLGMADSTTHLRFANFSEDQVVSVNLKGQPTGSFIQQIPEKSWSEFTQLKANKTVARYEFEIRDFNTGDLIATYIADRVNDFTANNGTNLWYNKSNTAILIGKQGGTGTLLPRVVLMPHR